jgi:hypothetical protein
MRVQANLSKPLGYRRISGLSTVKTLDDGTDETGASKSRPAGASFCLIDCESQVVRWLDTGTAAPTSGSGKRIAAGGELLYDGDLGTIRFVEEAASAALNVTFYGFADA